MKAQPIDQTDADARIAILESQLSMTQGATLARRIAEIEAALEARQAQHAELAATVAAHRATVEAHRATVEDAKQAHRQAQRAAGNADSQFMIFRDATRHMRNDLEALKLQLSGHTAAMAAPIVRSLPHSPRP